MRSLLVLAPFFVFLLHVYYGSLRVYVFNQRKKSLVKKTDKMKCMKEWRKSE
ncbi:hypothetical protein T4D_11741 [Trichinella pseudospiralis]|uniref:Uncharacterized protein n=1 Tax=Trichinella pseudospiralis TaxID=6337 RepID=A0A0V1DT20_TRIPS|nr:hypothetical protein T4D_11741 [Trichinella pseudospiralis]